MIAPSALPSSPLSESMPAPISAPMVVAPT
jgi:hypothetical protein